MNRRSFISRTLAVLGLSAVAVAKKPEPEKIVPLQEPNFRYAYWIDNRSDEWAEVSWGAGFFGLAPHQQIHHKSEKELKFMVKGGAVNIMVIWDGIACADIYP